jgi:hypothetical protein
MSKKLIAVASAAALALAGLVGVTPANASFGGSLTILDASTTNSGLTATAPLISGDNTLNTIVVSTTVPDGQTTSTAARFAYSGLTNGKILSVRASGPVKILERDTAGRNTGETINGSSGVQSLDLTVAGGAATFFVHSSSTTATSFTVSYEGNTTVYWIRAAAGAPYNVTATLPAALGASQTGDILVKVTDHRGNFLKGASDGIGWVADTAANGTNANSGIRTLIMTALGAGTVVGNSNGSSFTWSVARDSWVGKVTAGATGGALSVNVAVNSVDLSSVGYAEPVSTAFGTMSAANLAGLTAQVTALTAQVAALRADYNALAERWNKRVKKAKNKVALK